MSFDLTGQNIKDTYKRIIQYDSASGNFYDGSGSLANSAIVNLTSAQRQAQDSTVTSLSSSVSTLTDATSSYAIVGSSNTFTGLQTFSSGVTINGIATEFNSRVSINGNTTIGDRDTDTLEVNAQSTFNETLQVQANITASGHVSASTYYGDGSNLSGISSTPFPFEGDAIITGSLTVSASFVDFSEATVVNIPNLESLSLVNPKVEYLDVTASISSGTSITLPNNLSYVSSSVYEYLEVFMNGLRLRYNRDFVPTSNTTIQNQMHFPSGSELTFKSLKR